MNTLIPILLAGSVLAAPPGYKVTKEIEGCQLMLGPAEADGTVPMRAECHWPDIELSTFHKALGSFADHDLIWASVTTCDVVRTEGDRTLTHQVHVSKGISDREIMLWLSSTPIEGGTRYQWTASPPEPLTPKDGNVVAARDDGYCEASAHPDGGIRVAYQLAYDPGGSVPGWLVRWFQSSGLQAIVTDLRSYLLSHP